MRPSCLALAGAETLETPRWTAGSARCRRLCCADAVMNLKDQIDPRGLRLTNAIVVGCLDLAGLSVPFPLRFGGCEFGGRAGREAAGGTAEKGLGPTRPARVQSATGHRRVRCPRLMTVTEIRPAADAGAAQWLLRSDVDWWDLVRYGPPG